MPELGHIYDLRSAFEKNPTPLFLQSYDSLRGALATGLHSKLNHIVGLSRVTMANSAKGYFVFYVEVRTMCGITWSSHPYPSHGGLPRKDFTCNYKAADRAMTNSDLENPRCSRCCRCTSREERITAYEDFVRAHREVKMTNVYKFDLTDEISSEVIKSAFIDGCSLDQAIFKLDQPLKKTLSWVLDANRVPWAMKPDLEYQIRKAVNNVLVNWP